MAYLCGDETKVMQDKVSIRFYNDRQVRAVWSEEESKWFFSATDVVRAINDENDYVRAGNYWRWLKKKLLAQGIQLVSGTHGFKFAAPDGKKRLADVLDDTNIRQLLRDALTDDIDSREMFMKGIDYSYYYEEN